MDVDKALADAVAHHQAGRLAEATAGYRAIIAHDPENAAAWINLGAGLRAGGDPKAAAAALERAVQLVPDHAGAHLNLGNALVDLGDMPAATRAFDIAAELTPESADAYLNWGDALARTGDDEAAVAVYEAGLGRAPEDTRLLTNIGNSLLNLHDAKAAIPLLETACRLQPADPTAQRNLANAWRLAGQPARAAAIFDELLDQSPGDAEASCLRAFARFTEGRFAEAWIDYRARWRSAHHEAPRPFHQPTWTGENLAGKTLLVWGEQAVGDELMFATMLAGAMADAGRVIVETEHRLQPLLARAFPDAEVVVRRDPPSPRLLDPDIDFQIAMGDLGALLRPDLAAFQQGRPYLKADPARAQILRDRYGALAGGRPRIGISWRSGVERAGNKRSLDAAALASLIGGADVWWLSLQYGDIAADLACLTAAGVAPPHVDAGLDPLESLDDLAAQIAGLDMVVSVANTTVHMAGALGRPTLALLPHVADWRWRATGESCHWYPTVRLLRQPGASDWAPVVTRAVLGIGALANDPAGRVKSP